MYIGKEANGIDEQELDVRKPQQFIDEEKVRKYILDLVPEEARKVGIKHRSALVYLKKKAKEGELNYNVRNVRKIICVMK